MKLEEWLDWSVKKLEKAGVGTARLDCLVLLEDELGKDRSWILAHPEVALQGGALKALNKKVARRIKHEPLAYIRGYTEFYGRKFGVNKNVLEPRPESETMIELLKQQVNRLPFNYARGKQVMGYRKKELVIADIGTGSGCLGITAKLEVPEAEVIAIDIDPNCLKVARQNAQALGAKIKFRQGDLLDPLCNLSPVTCHLILANLPYVPDNWQINEAAAMEPRLAIFGGHDGLDLYRRLFEQTSKLSWQPKYIFTESLPPQHNKLAKIANQSGYKLQETRDFIQLFSKLDVGR